MPVTDVERVTSLQDLANLAGISRSTASRALNDNPRISKETRRKVKELAQAHGFVVNRRARDLRLQRTHVISVVLMIDMRSRQHMSDLFFMEMLGAIADASAAQDYDLLLSHTPYAENLEETIARIARRSDGLIIVGQERQHHRLNTFADSGKPFIVWGQSVPSKRYPVVGIDNFEGGKMVTRELIETGRQKIAFFGGVDNPELEARFEGYKAALAEGGMKFDPQLHFDVPFSMKEAQVAIEELLKRRSDFDAVVCLSDVMAMATVAALKNYGLRVPDDVAVTGYDDIGLAAFTSPPLTTVSQSIGTAGEALVNGLIAMINGDKVSDTRLPARLIVRESSRAAKV